MTVYVTGASGFIGSAAVEAFLEKGEVVRSVSRKLCPVLPLEDNRQILTNRLFEARWFDEKDSDATIVHCAGLANPRMSFDSLNDIYKSEVQLHVSMVETLIQKGWKGRLIFLSSGGTVYGDAETLPTPESEPLRPKTAYGLYKVHLENDFTYLAHTSEIEVVSLRVSNPYGGFVRKAGQGVIPILIDAMRFHRTFQLYGDGSAERDYIAMKDLCDAIYLASRTKLDDSSLTLNIGSGRGVSLRHIIALLEEISGRQLSVAFGPLGENVLRNVLCCDQAKRVLNWSAQISLEDGLSALLEQEGLKMDDR
ncbi:MAG: NAD-dependent epimerase/dehydratase family protein [Roseovarius sp.]